MTRMAIAALLLAISASAASADQYVNGYSRSNGTYVQPYYRTAPDANPYNNYSTRGNVNPYTGQPGTHAPSAGGYGGSPSYGGTGGYGGASALQTSL